MATIDEGPFPCCRVTGTALQAWLVLDACGSRIAMGSRERVFLLEAWPWEDEVDEWTERRPAVPASRRTLRPIEPSRPADLRIMPGPTLTPEERARRVRQARRRFAGGSHLPRRADPPEPAQGAA